MIFNKMFLILNWIWQITFGIYFKNLINNNSTATVIIVNNSTTKGEIMCYDMVINTMEDGGGNQKQGDLVVKRF